MDLEQISLEKSTMFQITKFSCLPTNVAYSPHYMVDGKKGDDDAELTWMHQKNQLHQFEESVK
jgi:hypothetical protein